MFYQDISTDGSFPDSTAVSKEPTSSQANATQLQQGLLINDIVFEEDDWGIMGSTPFAQLYKARQNVLACSTCGSIVIKHNQ